jgi:3-oxoacyl-(acyl-carrier-protein) synthase
MPNIKFFKMDNLAKLGYVTAAELFAKAGTGLQNLKPTEIGIILSNHSASLDTDLRHQQNTANGEPSPAVFVYTLPNVAAGEICITHHIKGENTFFIDMPPAWLEKYARSLIENGELKAVIYGEIELLGEKYNAELNLITE